MKRVLYVHHGGTVGGAPRSLLCLLEQMDRRRYEPIVLCISDGPMVELFRKSGIETHVVSDISDFSQTELVWYGKKLLWQLPGKSLRFFLSVEAARRHVEYFQPDLVHVNSSTLAAVAQAAFEAGKPVVWPIREPLAGGYFGLRRRWLRHRIQLHATRVIAISEYDAARLLPSDRIRTIYNFVDFTVFDRGIDASAARVQLNLSPSHQVVTMLGGCSEVKGTLPFVRSLELVQSRIPNVRFLVVGPRPSVGVSHSLPALIKSLFRVDAYDQAVMDVARSAVDSGSLCFLATRDDVPQVLAASDLLVFPSTVPHFARPVIEAGAMAKAVVASDLGGPRELVHHDHTGLLVSPDNPHALSDAIISILTDPVRSQALGEAGYRHARKLFDAQSNAKRTFDVYEEILGI